ncbi:hemolysin III family protein [Nigerium sp.]|uniref:PAQR family membrane homeostasis protein TrhA n=1 Tax=Nigerium sp. TaxID=2042655 RepID=UPI003221864C
MPLHQDLTSPLSAVKPKLRGWLHLAMTPLALVGGILLIVFAPTASGKVGGAIYLACSLLLFGTSATYHRGHWGPRGEAVLRRMDHANIFLFIAGTYTPLALMLLTGRTRAVLLTVVWSVAIAGVAFRVCWLSAPRWLYTLLYVGLGWAAVGWLRPFYESGGPLVLGLILAGGLIYSAGALVYARRRPDPWPTWFGFHEIFHACTILAASCHFAAICLITFR